MAPPPKPQTVKTVDVNYVINGTGVFLFTFGGNPYKSDYNSPILCLADDGAAPGSYNSDWNVNDFGRNTSIRLIITNSVPISHPMHLHGHAFWILAEGNGEWDGTITHPSNPLRRDTLQVEAANAAGPGYIVIEFEADNPGVWPLHCHVAGHASTGLYLNVLVRGGFLFSSIVILVSLF